MARRRALLLVAALVCWAGTRLASSQTAPPLPPLGVAASEVTVSGVSSGAIFATQVHVAFSRTFRGVGALAGGPWYCTLGDLAYGLATCLRTPERVDVPALVAAARAFADAGEIDPLGHLAQSRNVIYAGVLDSVVDPGYSVKLEEFYTSFVNGTDARDGRPFTLAEYTVVAEHTMPTDFYDQGNACNVTAPPYISNCGYDLAGVVLAHMYFAAPLAPRAAYEPASLVSFDQAEFGGLSMDPVAYAYVPAACRAGGCRLHVAFHGCNQYWTAPDVGLQFVEFAGFNSWAEANRIVVLYPQTAPSVVLGNPAGCWDWWGYTGDDFITQSGPQMQAIYRMVQRLLLPVGSPPIAAQAEQDAS